MDNRLYDLLGEGITLITPTQRLSRYLHFQYAQHQLKNGNNAWQTPDCLPWTAWCKRTYEMLAFQSNGKHVLLNQLQQQWLWQDVINSSNYKEQLLQTSATAKQAQYAYQLCKEWCVPIFPDGMYLTDDAFAFNSWVSAYEKQKQLKHYLDDASLPDYIFNSIENKHSVFGKLGFYGFDNLTTQQTNLIEALKKSGTKFVEFGVSERNQSSVVSVQNDKSSELIAAACWAKQQLEENPEANIGIVSPNLNAIKNAVEQAFDSVFDPAHVVRTEQLAQKIYSISLGKPLLSYPLIHTAINLLSLGKRYVSLHTLGSLLHSPFIKDISLEQAKRANFDAALRRVGEQRLSLKSLYRIHEQRCQEHEQCESFIQLLKTFEISFLSHAKTQSLRQWAINFSEWLSIFGWPGERALNSDEHQTVTAWQTALTQLGSLDGLSKPVSFSIALYQLNRILSETRFQPETPETPIQILGLTGAAGMQFDSLWVLNMQDDAWPNLIPANPFIPLRCQRDFSVPTANAASQLKLAKQITEQLIRSAKHAVLSYVKQEGDRECRPSPLIKEYIKDKVNDTFEDYKNFKKTIYASAELEGFIDIKAPMIPAGELANGGSALFKDQAACPFKAFARHRLHAQSLKHIDIGLNAIERGNLAHLSLQYLWQKLKTREGLDYKSDAELEKLIQSVVAEAIKHQVSQQPETFTDRFTKLEQKRLQKLLKEWLDIERHRNEFKVLATEQWQTLVFQDIELHLRVDRIDELADGRCVIIDYKTGAVSKSDWESENPNDPQLPLYAITSKQEVAAIAYASLKRGKLGFVGQADSDDILPGVKPNKDLPWQEQLEIWKSVLIILANDFREGKAIVEPTVTACRYCDLHVLCRIHERVEKPNEMLAQEGMVNG